ncbi:gliding motility-associated C-terminal domain-containing protein [Kaistella flava (ex Peng et al. 2021)]|uniref:Gliding motility-associated C-terminal domain-containing protein n=1 Tax=Kaistella flava (ex Peng et al. 2021) TaxID=2038776 RepID=A0A7M2Y4N9_9FLAO|nr:T9SS type B sorting domain-containing protein [Kaistella flava (ex Peng et al. 2021)]QOW09080.1 gliding motility-associated C-terminal domain-containing protein [Kaistella flava (ex Peng et al. 2021)]
MKKFYFLFFLGVFSLGFSQSVQLYNPNTSVVYPNEQFFCVGEKFNFKVDAVSSSTGDYGMTNVSSSDFGLTAGSIPINFPSSGADKFSEAFPIGFNFSFYGKTYSKVVMGSNGRLVFTNDPELDNLKNNTVYVDRTFSGVTGYNTFSALPSTDYNKIFRTNPTQELNLAQIFFGYTDLVPKSSNGSVNYLYKNVNLNGVKGLMVSFQNQIRTNGTGGISSNGYNSYVLLLEDGRVVIYVSGKTEITYNAILGMQNDDATKFKVPTHSNTAYNYNNGPWKSEGIATLFTPNQNLTPKFKWYQNGTLLPENSDTLLNFTPNDNDVLKVEVTYEDPITGTQIGSAVSDQVLFKRIPKPVISSNSAGGCVSGVTMTVSNDPDLNFEWFRVGNNTVLGTGSSYYATQTGNYFVRASRKILPVCSEDSAPFSVNLNSTIPAFNPNNTPLYFCETAGVVPKDINLFDYYPTDPIKYTLKFFHVGNEVLDPANFYMLPNTSITVTVDVKDPVSGCELNHDFVIRYDALPTSFNIVSQKYCFAQTSLDLANYHNVVAGLFHPYFDYLYSTDGINYSTNSLVNPQLNPKVWFKILPKNALPGSCFTVSSIVFSEYPKVIANTPTTQLSPQCASTTQTFDLASLISEINPDPNVTVTFHNTFQNAIDGIGAVAYNFRSGLGDTTLYIRVADNLTGCVSPDHPDITLLVYKKPTKLVNALNGAYCQGTSNINITQNAILLVNAPSPITVSLEYYSTNGTLLTGTQITNYDIAVFGLNPYVKLVYNTTCSDIIPMSISFLPKPVAIKSQILICSEVNYSLQNFKNEVINNSSNYTFTDLSGAPLPANFNLSTLPVVVNFLMKDNATGCISDPQTVTFIQGVNSVLLTQQTDFTDCDKDFDGRMEFDLDSKKLIFTTDTSAKFEYFKDVNLTQTIVGKYTNETAFAQTIFVRITIAGFCPSTAKINLKVNTPKKSSTLIDKYFICYGETLTINAGSENDIFDWSDGKGSLQTATFTKPGTYSVTLQKGIKGCPYTHNFTISNENQPKIKVINQTNNSIEVIAEGGVKPYLYYFNGVPQSSNVLQNPTASSYKIQVESATGCLGEPKTVYFIKINNAFTPNGDGKNEVWKIDSLEKMEKVSIVIVDRNGTKVFESKNPSKSEWDGKHNGRALPTSTYWYVISWYDSVTQKTEQRQGWILMKNRN